MSIVIPVYNGENFMKNAIDSALGQSYENIEVLVINDGSTDNTDAIAKSYKDSIRYFFKENGGVSTALNLGIRNMKGVYFSWLSHDDLYTSDKIEKSLVAIKDEPTRIVYTDYDSIDKKGRKLGSVSAMHLHRAADHGYGLFPLVTGLIHGCSLLIHRSHFESVGVFDENLRATQDYVLFLEMFRGHRLKYVPESLVLARIHPKQVTNTYVYKLAESENLWTNMLKSLTCDDMRAIAFGERNFWIKQARFMEEVTKYTKTTEYAYKRLKNCRESLKGELVSVVIPFHNRLHLLHSSIKSVRRQSYQNWELILVNDGSTDDISEIACYESSDSRIKMISINKSGAAYARNVGIDTAKGKFIAFLDSDDVWDPLKLEKQINFMLEKNFCASHTNFIRTDVSGASRQKVELLKMNGDIFWRCLFACSIATPCVVVERDYLGKLRFPEGVEYGEDTCMWLELAWRGEWGHLPECLTTVLVGEESAYKCKLKQQIGFSEILRYVLKRPEWSSLHQYEIGILARHFAGLFIRYKSFAWMFSYVGKIPIRLIRAIRNYGLVSFTKIFIKRCKHSMFSKNKTL